MEEAPVEGVTHDAHVGADCPRYGYPVMGGGAPTGGCGNGPSSILTNGKRSAETSAGVALIEDGVAAEGAKPDRVK